MLYIKFKNRLNFNAKVFVYEFNEKNLIKPKHPYTKILTNTILQVSEKDGSYAI